MNLSQTNHNVLMCVAGVLSPWVESNMSTSTGLFFIYPVWIGGATMEVETPFNQ